MGKLRCSQSELNLEYTLSGGQSFRWKKTKEKKWVGVFANRIWLLHQNQDFLFYKAIENSDLLKNNSMTCSMSENESEPSNLKTDSKSIRQNDSHALECLLKHYFRLDCLNLKDAYAEWSKNDEHFKEISERFQGIRILNQDPVENLFSFICSSNNNIARISSMVQKMCVLFGDKIGCVNGEEYFDFPSIKSLAVPEVESHLRLAGFGYRARFIHHSAVKLMGLGGREWLERLKTLSYNETKKELMFLPGIGSKVADCVSLMSLGHLQSVPVDTHIFQVAAQWYLPHLRESKTVTPRIYQEIGDFFRKLYGPYAGWAHTILFCGNLKRFEDSLNVPTARKRKNSKTKKVRLGT